MQTFSAKKKRGEERLNLLWRRGKKRAVFPEKFAEKTGGRENPVMCALEMEGRRQLKETAITAQGKREI